MIPRGKMLIEAVSPSGKTGYADYYDLNPESQQRFRADLGNQHLEVFKTIVRDALFGEVMHFLWRGRTLPLVNAGELFAEMLPPDGVGAEGSGKSMKDKVS